MATMTSDKVQIKNFHTSRDFHTAVFDKEKRKEKLNATRGPRKAHGKGSSLPAISDPN